MGLDISKLKHEIDKMITHSTTKLIAPLLMLFYLEHVEKTKNAVVESSVVKVGYEDTVCNFIMNYASQFQHWWNI
jgi:hypothetical protein